ncbi:ImpE family protein [Bordetella genomosp. 9]|uniref:type VI secretion system accessory protein TagJ n=1 Tax=Bordetella genomosp. 9 TaxID=1416803 RepID=UPI000A28D759|nr:type VI secretion system accessory protein TagJ [Bordetella genomosp. 9]ARP91781.1 ImpE family protein [Bordetella genomosp. 9]
MTTGGFALRSGSLAQHLDAVSAQIRRHPGDADLRARLFQLLAVQGEWERAAEQIRLCAELNPQSAPMALTYDRAIAAERRRETVLAGQAEPHVPGPRPAWLDMLLDALRHDADAPAAASELRGRAFDAAQTAAGTLSCAGYETPAAFNWIADGDSRLGPVFEFIQGANYAWLPFSHVRQVRLLPPEGLSDVLWAQAEATLADGRVLHVLVPARYPAPSGVRTADQEEAVKLGRLTHWTPLHDDTYAGVGQKMWVTDQGEYGLLDIRLLELA